LEECAKRTNTTKIQGRTIPHGRNSKENIQRILVEWNIREYFLDFRSW
jgi:hypothetical protein